MTDIVDEFNKRVINTHKSHYEDGVNKLIDVNASPNANQIYHLYSNGEITHQKGGKMYLKRNEFCSAMVLPNAEHIPFKFVNHTIDENISYAILTEEECTEFRKEMRKIIEIVFMCKK